MKPLFWGLFSFGFLYGCLFCSNRGNRNDSPISRIPSGKREPSPNKPSAQGSSRLVRSDSDLKPGFNTGATSSRGSPSRGSPSRRQSESSPNRSSVSPARHHISQTDIDKVSLEFLHDTSIRIKPGHLMNQIKEKILKDGVQSVNFGNLLLQGASPFSQEEPPEASGSYLQKARYSQKKAIKAATLKQMYWNPPYFRIPRFPANVKYLRENWHLVTPVLPQQAEQQNLERFFTQNLATIKNPEKGKKFVTNLHEKELWSFCTAVSRNGMLLPLGSIKENRLTTQKVKITVANVPNGKDVPAVLCLFAVEAGAPAVRVFVTNGREEYSYFVGEGSWDPEEPVTLKSYFNQLKTSDLGKPNNKMDNYRFDHLKQINSKNFQVNFQIRSGDEFEIASQRILTYMLSKYEDMIIDYPIHRRRYFPGSTHGSYEEVIDKNNQFALAIVDGTIIGMAKLLKKNVSGGYIKYYVEPDFHNEEERIFENLLKIVITNSQRDCIVYNIRLDIYVLDKDGTSYNVATNMGFKLDSNRFYGDEIMKSSLKYEIISAENRRCMEQSALNQPKYGRRMSTPDYHSPHSKRSYWHHN